MNKQEIIDNFEMKFGKDVDVTNFYDEYTHTVVKLSKRDNKIIDFISKSIDQSLIIDEEKKGLVNGLCNSVIMVANSFMKRVECGKSTDRVTYSNMQKLILEAGILKNAINKD